MFNYFEAMFIRKAQYILPTLIFSIIIILYLIDVHMPYINDEYFWFSLAVILAYVSCLIEKYINYLYLRIYTYSLTNLKNRGYFYYNINKIIKDVLINEKVYSLIMLDIDHFKSINDKFGHQEGDNVLVKLSLLLKNNLRESDCVFRWGGEEFLILLKNTSKEEALIIIDRIRDIVANYKFSNREYKVTFSAGITEINKGLKIEEIINIADIALYEAKKKRNEIVIASDGKGGVVTL